MEVVNTTSTTDPVNMYNNLNNYILNPIVFIIIFLIIIAYYVFSSSLANNNSFTTSSSSSSDSNSNISSMMGIIIIAILIVLIIINGLQYFFSISVTAYIQGLFSPKTTVDIVVDQSAYEEAPSPAPVPEIKFKKQVFNIPGNYYSYENAKAICQAYGANLATYDQIEKAYNNGAEWCNYGWSDNQMALYPTQQKTYDNLQKIPGHEHDCGRPGINGGYIGNKKVKFGVNCYGHKPRITEEEDELMKTSNPYPETKQDILFQKQVDFWKNKVDEILVSPFNYDNWSSI
jgi:hypothetical protein